MDFHSILFEAPVETEIKESAEMPLFFIDLNLDQVVNSIVAGREQYNLKPFFFSMLTQVETIDYRHAVMQDLTNDAIFSVINSFSQAMKAMHKLMALSETLNYVWQKEIFFLDSVEAYCSAVIQLAAELGSLDCRSDGLRSFREFIVSYTQSDSFSSLLQEIRLIREAISAIQYCVTINGGFVRVTQYESEVDYSQEVESTFTKFRQGVVKDYMAGFTDYRSRYRDILNMNHVEAKILDLVAKQNPDAFASLDLFYQDHKDFMDATLSRFDREIQFYLAYREYMDRLVQCGLSFCYPEVTSTSKESVVRCGYDVALAENLRKDGKTVVCNDLFLKDPERIFIVSGPNQGGKTTFARMLGQLHYLACIGCPIPGREARIFLVDQIYTHFEKSEDVQNLRGKLQDDLIRIHRIMDQATDRSLIIMNEIFTSTTLKDAIFLGQEVMRRIIRLDALCVCVTFVEELSKMSGNIVSMVSTIVPENPAQRTFKIIRRPAGGLSYAITIAERHRLTYSALKERLPG